MIRGSLDVSSAGISYYTWLAWCTICPQPNSARNSKDDACGGGYIDVCYQLN
jgi:hypothetical protein